MKRIEFIKNTALGTASVLIPGTFLTACSKEDIASVETGTVPAFLAEERDLGDKSVIVVGAGAAGMHAASWLKAKGATVTILEASDRRGGRVKTLHDFADFPVEAGAEVIHGNKSELYRWAKQQGVQFVKYNSVDYYRLDGQLLSESQIQNDTDVKAAWNFITQSSKYKGVDKSVTQHANQSGIAQRVHHIINADLGNEYGTDNNRLSIKWRAEEESLWTAGNGDYLMKNRTFQQILDAKFNNILSNILYNKKVVRVDYSANNKPKVQDEQGVWYIADAILMTVPLTIFQNNLIEFSPALPTWKTNAFQNLGMGAGMKIILKFSNRFWDENLGFLISDQLGHVFWYTSKQRGNQHVLTLFVMGERAETLSGMGNAAVATILTELDNLYSNDAATSNFLASHIENWGNNPLIGGAYSYSKVGGNGVAARRDLAKNLNKKVFFAGEATHTKGHNSTLHGALETGLIAAREIWQSIK